MHSKSPLGLAIAALLATPAVSYAEIEVSAELKNETAVFLSSGPITGNARTTLDDGDVSGGDLMKFENSARIFINGDVGEDSTWHAELRPVYESEGVNDDYTWHRNYTQNDYLRELYIDTTGFDWDFRIGKQQVVWGTADGIKLLDIINPTDFRELNQNAFEDSRIPVWMVNAERYIGERGNIQLIISQNEENKVPGLNESGDSGHPFILKGVDAISGRVNGFLNIAPALSRVANTFDLLAVGGVGAPGLTAFAGAGSSVNGFATAGALESGAFGGACVPFTGVATASSQCLDGIAQNPTALGIPAANSNNRVTNLIDPQAPVGGAAASPQWNPEDPNSAFEHLSATSFATFDQYAAGGGMVSTYKVKRPDEENANLGFRYRSYTDSGINYSLNYAYIYDMNPSVSIRVKDPAGNELSAQNLALGADNITVFTDANGNQPCSAAARRGAGLGGASAGAFAGSTAPCILEFVEEQHRIHNLGASFDMAIDSLDVPLVLRGEFLYQKDVRTPVVDRTRLSYGDLVNGLKSEKADFFKYVIGADFTFLTNLLVSGQFIQFRNLDFVDKRTDSFTGAPCTIANCGRYTADPATLSATNGLNKGWKNKEFYSLFLSKPFGANQLGRWNNIIIYEEGGGYWNRLDAEYTLTDEWIVSGEINVYFGDDETTFGQFENSSNVQVGIKYIIE
ncbi:MAG: RNA polymerase-associated protein rapA [Gammaproteobacteria bacterium]|nr:RNA polymerase-associated protein rapA [Gammaproteobacteria bacterium]